MDKLAVVIVNWNTGKLLAQCVRSLFAVSDISCVTDVVIVDNGSTDTSLARLKEMLQTAAHKIEVHLVESKKNLGFAEGNNKGMQWLQEKYAAALPHVLLLNPDTEVHSGALTGMLEILRTQENAGIVGAKLVNTDGTLQPSVRSFPTTGIIAFTLLKLTRYVDDSSLWQRYLQHDFDYTRAQPVDQVMGAAFLIRNRLLRDVGLLDNGYFVWFEEVDYCKTAQEKGWQVWYTPGGVITHHGGTSFAQLVGFSRTIPWLRSSLRYAKKHLGVPGTLFLYVLAPLSVALSLPAGLAHRKHRQANTTRLYDAKQ